jgi:hypothetical protein
MKIDIYNIAIECKDYNEQEIKIIKSIIPYVQVG